MSTTPLNDLQEELLALLLADAEQEGKDDGATIQPLDPAGRQAVLPASFAQERVWFLDQVERQHSAGNPLTYLMQHNLHLQGRLNHDCLQQALNQLAARHETLRTSLVSDGERAGQRIAAATTLPLTVTDLRHLSTVAQRSDVLREQVAAHWSAGFDLAQGPLIRCALLQLDEEEHAFLITMHHAISDGWSIGILMRELDELYRAALESRAPALPRLPVQYADYAAWQRSAGHAKLLEQQLAFWRNQLDGMPPLLALPTDRPRPPAQRHAGAIHRVELGEKLTRALKALAQREGATLFMTLAAGFSLLLGRYANQDEVALGTSIANRAQPEVENLIGFFVNTLVLRTTLTPGQSFVELLAHARQTCLDALDNQDVPFEQLVTALNPERSLSYSPLFQVMFSLDATMSNQAMLGDARASALVQDNTPKVAKFDLMLALAEQDGVIEGVFEYSTDLFDAATIARMADQFDTLLAAIVAAPEQPLARLPLLTPRQHDLLRDQCAPRAAFATAESLTRIFERRVRQAPQRCALVFGELTLSYAELNRQANRLAHHLRGLGVGADTLVGLCVERSPDMIVGLLAILKAGGAYVPVDPAYPAERIAFTLTDARVALLLTRQTTCATLPALAAPILCLDSDAGLWAHSPDTDPDHHAAPTDLAYVIYTSGSSGQPKGVMVEHAQVVRLFAATEAWFGFGEDDVWSLFHSFAFDFSVWEIFGALLHGGRLLLVPRDTARSPEEFYALLCAQGVTILNQTPSVFRQLIAAQQASGAAHRLRHVIFGGEALETPTLAPWFAHPGNAATALVNMYGITETTVHVTYRPITPADAGQRAGSPIGIPIPDLSVYLLDAHGQLVPPGVTGEMYVGGAGVARGYLNRPELSAERFLPNPFSSDPTARLYRSGDLARRLPDGALEYQGRADAQVKIRGFRIELGEIEQTLLRAPQVREAVVLVREDVPGDKRLVAYLVTGTGAAPDLAGLRATLRNSLPEYMLPAAFVTLDRLPVTANGKLNARALPAPDTGAFGAGAYEAPLGAVETRMAEIWSELLKLDRIGRHDNFFELGGHSLLVVALIERMRRRGLHADVRSLFTSPTLAQLAGAIDQQEAAPTVQVPPNLIPLDCTVITPDMITLADLSVEEISAIALTVPGGASNIQDIYPLVPMQEGILFHHMMSGGADAYVMEHVDGFDSKARLDTYVDALRIVVARHDILRTSVAWEGLRTPMQVVWRDAAVPLEKVELDPAGGDGVSQLIARFSPAAYKLDITRAPLLRLFCAQDPASGRWLLLTLLHHLIDDNTTLKVMLAEIHAYLAGQADQLAAPLPFRHFVAQARLGISQAEHDAFFTSLLGDVDEPTMPFGMANVHGDGSDSTEQRRNLDPVLAQRLRQQARKLGVSVASLFHTAYAQVLARASGRSDVVFGTVLFGRMQGGEGVDRVMGLFVNTLPIRIRVEANGAAACVKSTHTLLANLMRHEHAPLVHAQRCSAVQAPAPLFSALFNYRHRASVAAIASTELQQQWDGIEGLATSSRTSFPLTVAIDDFGDGFLLSVQVQQPVEAAGVWELMNGALTILCDALDQTPDIPIGQLDILPHAHRQRVLHGFNDTAIPFPSDRCIHQLIEEQAARTPARIALELNAHKLSYRDLDLRANRLANLLQRHGVGHENLVGVCMERSTDMIVALLAILKAGAAYVPLDPNYPAARLGFMLHHAQVRLLVTDAASRPVLQDYSGITIELDGAQDILAQESDAKPISSASADSLAYVIYTSGSTGVPKGVMIEHRGVVNYLTFLARQYGLCKQDRTLQITSLSFDPSVRDIFGPLSVGATVCLMTSEDARHPERVAERIVSEDITAILSVTPSFLDSIALAHADGFPAVPHLRLLMPSGEALQHRHVSALRRLFGEQLRIVNQYGPTEGTLTQTFFPIEKGGDILIGKPIANMQILVLGTDMQPAPIGVAGELCIAGIGLARGYLHADALSAERFMAHPFAPGRRLYRTGDQARWRPDGNLEYLGRLDFQVKIRGQRIELGEIEATLGQHPHVGQTVVVAREDDGEQRLVAYVVAQGDAPEDDTLQDWLAARLPAHMLPSAIVLLDALPLTPSRKVDRRALPAPDWKTRKTQFLAPRGPVEATLARIVCELLRLPDVGMNDNFFALGGHSLLATQLLARVRRLLGVDLPLKQVFSTPTLSALARQIVERGITATDAPIVAAPRNGPVPASFGQERLWFLDQLEGDAASATYLMPGALHLLGTLNTDCLQRALQRIVERHEVLRTALVKVDGEASQLVHPHCDLPLVQVDLSALHGSELQAALQRQVQTHALDGFDLTQPPLIRACLVKLKIDDHVLLVNMHHCVSDGWSLSILTKELSILYTAFVGNASDPLNPLPIQYADFAAWQRSAQRAVVLDGQLAYWRQQLADLPTVLTLPTDRPRPPLQTYAGAWHRFKIGTALTMRLRELGREHEATLFMTLCAVFALLLGRHANQNDIALGTPVANRTRQELEGLIGLFVNTLVIRTHLDQAGDFGALLRQVADTCLQAYAHQDIPFEQLVSALNPERNRAYTPLFQVMIVLQNAAAIELELPGLRLSPGVGGDAQVGVAKFDLLLTLSERNGALDAEFEYNIDLFDEANIARMAERFVVLLEEVTQRPSKVPVLALDLLPPSEREALQRFNATDAPFPAQACLHHLVEQQAERTPDATALVCEGVALSYAQLNARANRLAHYLQRRGVAPDTLVGVCADRSLDLVCALLAVLKAGGAYLPVDPDYPAERIAFLIDDAALPLVLTQAHLRARLGQHTAVLCLDADHAAWQDLPDQNPVSAALPASLAYVIYTSGSTGNPKGAMNEHRGVVNRLHWMQERYRLAPHDRVLQKTPFSFDVSVWEFFWPLTCGATLVMARPGGHRDSAYLADLIDQQAITTVHFVPSMLQVFLAESAGRPCPSLRQAICSGEALPYELTRRFHAVLPHVRLHNLYGPTECAVDVTAWECLPGDERGIVPIGAPIANTRMYVLDPAGTPTPIGVAGELHIGGVQVGRGYLNRAELTAERFIADPFTATPGARLYKTGDLARWLPDGTLEYLGRLDFQVKLRGFRIELGEIEHCLASHAQLEAAAVLAREDRPGDLRLVAYVVPVQGCTPDPAMLREHVRAALPEYMVPAACVILHALPLSANGKLDRKALPAPDQQAFVTQDYAAPEGPAEFALAAIWSTLLAIPRIGRNDNFFELGGHSLLAVKLVDRMRLQGLHATVADLFATPRLCDLAAATQPPCADLVVPASLIGAHCTAITPAMLPLVTLSDTELDIIRQQVPGGDANIQDIYPLAPLQEGILYHHLLATEGDAYLLSRLTAFATRAQLDAYTGALEAVVARHDILRTAVLWEGLPAPVQVVWRHAVPVLEEVAFEPNTGDAVAQLRARFSPRRHRIEVREAPLLRLYAMRDADDRWVLLTLMHHLAGDHTTLEIMFDDIRAHLQGQAEQLPPAVPFRDFVVRARNTVSQAEHESFFRAMLADVDEPTAPFGLHDVKGDGTKIREARLMLPAPLAQRLRHGARQLGMSPATMFHHAWALVLSQLTGRDDVVFGTVLFGRMQSGAGADRAMGVFINTLPVRIRLGAVSVIDGLRATHNMLATLLRHEHAPLALAQRCSAVPAPAPLFSSLFNFRHSAHGTGVIEADEADPWEGMEGLGNEERSNYPFDLSVDDLGEGFSLRAQIREPIAPERVCRMMHTALWRLADALEQQPDLASSGINILDDDESTLLLHTFNSGKLPEIDKEVLTICELFERQVKANPEAIAVIDADGATTYAELNYRVRDIAQRLQKQGVAPEQRVAICSERNSHMVAGILGILQAGAAYVPLDPDYPADRLAFILSDCAPAAVLVQRTLSERLALAGQPHLILDEPTDGAAATRAMPEPRRAAYPIGRHLAYVIYTSGSTGQPKGVMVEHRNLLASTLARHATYGAGGCFMLLSSFAFDSSVAGLFGTLTSGGCLLVLAREQAQAPDRIAAAIMRHDVTTLLCVPSLARLILDELPQRHQSSLRDVIVAGEVCPPALVTQAAAFDPPMALYNEYGPTEATVWATVHRCTVGEAGAVPIGRPVAGTRVYVLDAHGRPAPLGVAGELYVGGPQVSRGYLSRPDLSAEKFVTDPFSGLPDARLYRTGDVALWRADGMLDYVGRCDFQLKIRGFRIEPGEIENCLLQYPGIKEAIVLAREDHRGDQQLLAYVAPVPEHTGEVLRQYLQGLLPHYMVPAAIIALDRLPQTSNGKIDRQALPPLHQHSGRSGKTGEAPRDQVEWTIAQFWEAVLGREHDGIFADFFESGGHSLSAVQLMSKLRREFAIDLPLAALFSHSSIAELATLVRRETSPAALMAALVPIRQGGSQRPLFVVHPALGTILCYAELARRLGPDQPVYGLQAVGQFGERAPLASVEHMAQHYLHAMRSVQPEGPYRLLGWSSGGVIAYEMARRLRADDEQVEFLGLVDSYAPAPASSHDECDSLLGLQEVWPLTLNADALRALPASERRAWMVAQCAAQGVVMPGRPASYLDVILANAHATSVYRPEPSDVVLHMFNATQSEEPGGGEKRDPAPDWARLCAHPLQVTRIEGTHSSLLKGAQAELLAGLVRSALDGVVASAGVGHTPHEPLVLIRTGSTDGRRIFCIPGAGANVSYFRLLAERLDADATIYGLQPRGLDGTAPPHAGVEAMARAYVKAMLPVLNEDDTPYLIGHSFGAQVAFEIALQLSARGIAIGGLALVDPGAPATLIEEPRPLDAVESLLRLADVLGQSASAPLGIDAAQLEPLDRLARIELLRLRMVEAALLPARAPSVVIEGMVRVFQANINAIYRPTATYAGPVLLLFAQERRQGADRLSRERTLECWRQLASDLTTAEMAGNHMSILDHPHVDALAKRIVQAWKEADDMPLLVERGA